MNSSILVIGSSNTDMVIKADKLPLPGETILGGRFFMYPGGKGANQAVAAARLGGRVTLISKVGNDIFGKEVLQELKKEGINTDFIISDLENPSGVALITVDSKGENSIVVVQGSNGALTPEDIQKAIREFSKIEILLMQLEIPLQTVLYSAKYAHSLGKKVILNPAPAMYIPQELFKILYLITPNKSEAEMLTGIKISNLRSIEEAARNLKEKGVRNVIVTLGSQGAYIFNEEGGELISPPAVKAVDTTAAGDVFNGALSVAISEGKSFEEAVNFANHAAAISVTRMGAQASAPYLDELNVDV